MKVRCNWCDWVGDENEIAVDENDTEHCPQCSREGFLMDITEEENV